MRIAECAFSNAVNNMLTAIDVMFLVFVNCSVCVFVHLFLIGEES